MLSGLKGIEKDVLEIFKKIDGLQKINVEEKCPKGKGLAKAVFFSKGLIPGFCQVSPGGSKPIPTVDRSAEIVV
jgi:hypothetical protein